MMLKHCYSDLLNAYTCTYMYAYRYTYKRKNTNIKHRSNIASKNVLIAKTNVLYNNTCNNIIKFDMVISWKSYICFNLVSLRVLMELFIKLIRFCKKIELALHHVVANQLFFESVLYDVYRKKNIR